MAWAGLKILFVCRNPTDPAKKGPTQKILLKVATKNFN